MRITRKTTSSEAYTSDYIHLQSSSLSYLAVPVFPLERHALIGFCTGFLGYVLNKGQALYSKQVDFG